MEVRRDLQTIKPVIYFNIILSVEAVGIIVVDNG